MSSAISSVILMSAATSQAGVICIDSGIGSDRNLPIALIGFVKKSVSSGIVVRAEYPKLDFEQYDNAVAAIPKIATAAEKRVLYCLIVPNIVFLNQYRRKLE